MAAYIARRILLMFPTLLGILFVSFVVVQFAPGGPVERVIAQLSGADTGGSSRISGSSTGDFAGRTPQAGASADAVVIQADHAEYRTVSAMDAPGARVVVDGRRVSSAAAWPGADYRVIGQA